MHVEDIFDGYYAIIGKNIFINKNCRQKITSLDFGG